MTHHRTLLGMQKGLERAGKVVGLAEHIEQADHLEAIRTARELAIAGLPKQRTRARNLSRILRLGTDLWLRVTYSAQEGHDLPFGQDRFVLAGIQHLALEQNSPTVLFDRVGTLLKTFGLREDGKTIARLRKRFIRLAGLTVRMVFARAEHELQERATAEQIFIIRQYSLPSRKDLHAEQAGQLTFPGAHPYGVVLSRDFWAHLSDSHNRLLVPLELLKHFIARPTGWDYLCFLTARCGAAQRTSTVPHEALMSLFRDTERQPERNIIRALRRYHREILLATGGRLKAELVKDGVFPSSGGRVRNRWSLIIRPSQSLFERGQTLIEL